MNRVTVVKSGVLAVERAALPILSASDILVKTHAVALNPTDWKHLYFLSKPGDGLGCDFAGTVEKVGAGVTRVAVGDRVAGFVHGGRWEGIGSFAEYVKTDGALVWKVPKSTSWEEAAALGGIGPHTAVQALYFRHGLPQPSSPLATPEPFLVWGGATSVGLYAIQLAKLSGYQVIATASEKNFELVKSYGADAVYSYSDPETPARISAAFPTLALALDTISESKTTQATAKSLGTKGSTPRKILHLLAPQPEDNAGVDVVIEPTLVYTVIGKEFEMRGKHFPANPQDKIDMTAWLDYVPSLIEAGKFKSNPIWKQPGGLDRIGEGLELLKANKNSGQKVVFAL